MADWRRLAALGAVVVILVGCSVPILPTPEPTPHPVGLVATDRDTQEPVAGATVRGANGTAVTGADGTATVIAIEGEELAVTAPGYDAGQVRVSGSELEIALRNNRLEGTVRDEAGTPLAGVRVFVDGGDTYVETNSGGQYQLDGVPESGSVVYKTPGHRLGVIPITTVTSQDVTLPTFEARALYAPGGVFEGTGRLDQMLTLLEESEANAVVIDVKEAGGYLYYQTDLGPAVTADAVLDNPIFVLEELLPALKERGIYTIARMVAMKDNTLAGAHPDLAVQNSSTGEPWTDWGGNVWLDPSSPGVAEYLAAIAGDLAARGFDEVQLDYIRFFSDGPYDQAVTRLPNTQSFRLPAIRRVMRTVSETLDTTHTFLGADVFPISFIAADDQGIGQRPEVIMPFVDYFSPMVYPSHYGPGVFNIAVPNEHPYEMISETLKIMNREAEGLRMKIRPWIQDFGYGPYRAYGAADVEAEMAALDDFDASGWMIWNSSAHFTEEALGPPREDEDSYWVVSADPPA